MKNADIGSATIKFESCKFTLTACVGMCYDRTAPLYHPHILHIFTLIPLYITLHCFNMSICTVSYKRSKGHFFFISPLLPSFLLLGSDCNANLFCFIYSHFCFPFTNNSTDVPTVYFFVAKTSVLCYHQQYLKYHKPYMQSTLPLR